MRRAFVFILFRFLFFCACSLFCAIFIECVHYPASSLCPDGVFFVILCSYWLRNTFSLFPYINLHWNCESAKWLKFAAMKKTREKKHIDWAHPVDVCTPKFGRVCCFSSILFVHSTRCIILIRCYFCRWWHRLKLIAIIIHWTLDKSAMQMKWPAEIEWQPINYYIKKRFLSLALLRCVCESVVLFSSVRITYICIRNSSKADKPCECRCAAVTLWSLNINLTLTFRILKLYLESVFFWSYLGTVHRSNFIWSSVSGRFVHFSRSSVIFNCSELDIRRP